MMSRMILVNRNYARLWIGLAVSGLGDQIFNTTIFLWIATVLLQGERLAPVAVGGVVMAVAVATVLVGPLAGVFVDRWDKRRTMMASDALRAGLVGLLGAFAFVPRDAVSTGVTLAVVYAVLLLNSATAQFFRPAMFTLISDIVPDEAGRAKASGIGQATMAASIIVGPPLAAPLLFAVGFQWAIVINALSFVVSYVAVRAVRPPATPAAEHATREASVWAEFREGVRFVATNRVVQTLFLSAVVVTMGVGVLNTLDVFFVTENLHTDASLYGFLGTAQGVGVVVGSVFTGWLVARLGGVRVFWLGLIVCGLTIVGYARSSALVPAMVALAVCGAAVGTVNAALGPIMMGAVPRELMGRVVSVIAPAQQVASIASALVASWLVASVLDGVRLTVGPVTFGRLDLIFTAAGLLFVLGGLYSAVVLRAHREPAATAAAEEPATV